MLPRAEAIPMAVATWITYLCVHFVLVPGWFAWRYRRSPYALRWLPRNAYDLGESAYGLLVESLLERELRRAMESERIESLPLYPEGRACRRPTARKVIDLFEEVQRHELSAGRRPAVVFTTKLSRLQRRILRLLGMPRAYRG